MSGGPARRVCGGALLPDVADVGQQHGEVSQAQRLLLSAEAQPGDGPDQRVHHRVQQAQQPGPALQLLRRLGRSRAQIWGGEERRGHVIQVM